ncbi:MAG: GGDEF domain-containing protein [Planctomycetota bacterium]
MSRPGFRKGRPGGGKAAPTREGGEGFVSGSMFSQAQILHLMKTEFARSRRHGMALGCLLLQVDRMAQLVDLYGVELRTTVRDTLHRLVRERTRGADMLGVVNEDRYLLVLPHTNVDQTRVVADRLHALFREYEVVVDGRALDLSLSVGITATGESQAMFFDTLVGQAEAALEFAVERGGNRICSFGETQLLGGEQPTDDRG